MKQEYKRVVRAFFESDDWKIKSKDFKRKAQRVFRILSFSDKGASRCESQRIHRKAGGRKRTAADRASNSAQGAMTNF